MLVTVRVVVVDGVGSERQEHADDNTVTPNSDSAAGTLFESNLRLATVRVGVVSSEVVDAMVVVVMLLFPRVSIALGPEEL